MPRRSLVDRLPRGEGDAEGLEEKVAESMKESRGKAGGLTWILVYDFLEVRENSARVRKFYRNLKKIDGGSRWTDSELVFEDGERALLARDLASACGGKVRLYVGVEISPDP